MCVFLAWFCCLWKKSWLISFLTLRDCCLTKESSIKTLALMICCLFLAIDWAREAVVIIDWICEAPAFHDLCSLHPHTVHVSPVSLCLCFPSPSISLWPRPSCGLGGSSGLLLFSCSWRYLTSPSPPLFLIFLNHFSWPVNTESRHRAVTLQPHTASPSEITQSRCACTLAHLQ